MEVAVIIPTLNEETTIGSVVQDFKKLYENVIVCDGNSTDRTREIAKKLGAKVIVQHTKGKGNAIRECFEEIDADIYLLVDGDATYIAEDAPKLIEPIINREADMVIGSRINERMEKGAMRKLHIIGNVFFKWLMYLLFKKNVPDILSGYRAINKYLIKNISLSSTGFEIETELTIKALNEDYRIKYVPITYKRRPSTSKSKLNSFGDGYIIFSTIISLFKYYRPFTFFSYLSLFLFTIGSLLGASVVYEWIATGSILRIPTTILSVLLILASIQLFSTGLIIDFINNKLRK